MRTRRGVRWKAASAMIALLGGMAVVPAASAQAPPRGGAGSDAPASGVDAARGNAAERAAAWDRGHRPPRTLREGTPAQAGLSQEQLAALGDAVAAGVESDPPAYAGAVVLAARDGVVAALEAHGEAVRYADDVPTVLPEEERVPTSTDTIFDLASVSKLFTTVAVLQLVEDGDLDLDAPVAEVIPRFAAAGKAEVTFRHLLTHTAGLPAWLPLWSQYDTPEERLAAVYEVEPTHDPGEAHVYSDLGLIVLGEAVAHIAGQGLDEVVGERIIEPLGMVDTGYEPDPDLVGRIAATEYQPYAGRGMVHGEVHDENAWALGGVAGHAGLFSTAEDLGIFAQMLLNGGRYGQARILQPGTVQELMQLQTADLDAGRALGFEVAQRWYMDAMTTPATTGHTGFTGTSLVLDPTTDSFLVLLTNRVHPGRDGPNVNPYRAAAARAVARAVPVDPVKGRQAWFSGLGEAIDHRMEVDVDLPEGTKELSLSLWYDLGPQDAVAVELSTDDGDTWHPLAGRLTAPRADARDIDGIVTGWGERRWWDATFDLDDHEGPATLRVRYRSDDAQAGRGAYIDAVRLMGPRGPLFDDQRPADRARWRTDGWHRSAD